MALSYKNLSKEKILNDFRNINYLNCDSQFNFNNTIELQLDLDLDPYQVFLQGDVFARELLTHRAMFDPKRFLGSSEIDWLRLLTNAYVYDRIRCVYYGINANDLLRLPENISCFPGNALLMNLLIHKSFNFRLNDENPHVLYTNIKHPDRKFIFESIFDIEPDLKDGLSDIPNVISYVNFKYETILNGLSHASEFMRGKFKEKGDLYQMVKMHDPLIKNFLNEDSNPITNSFLNKKGDKFYFTSLTGETKRSLRFNESMFITRSIGLTSDDFKYKGNSFYNVSSRDQRSDVFTREDVYSVTGLRSELVPYSMSQIKEYLGINSYKADIVQIRSLSEDNDKTP